VPMHEQEVKIHAKAVKIWAEIQLYSLILCKIIGKTCGGPINIFKIPFEKFKVFFLY
jgi:hypothetical protein